MGGGSVQPASIREQTHVWGVWNDGVWQDRNLLRPCSPLEFIIPGCNRDFISRGCSWAVCHFYSSGTEHVGVAGLPWILESSKALCSSLSSPRLSVLPGWCRNNQENVENVPGAGVRTGRALGSLPTQNILGFCGNLPHFRSYPDIRMGIFHIST